MSSACIVTHDLTLPLGDLAYTIPLITPYGSPTRWEFPEHHSSLPSDIQKSFGNMGTPHLRIGLAFITKVYSPVIRAQ